MSEKVGKTDRPIPDDWKLASLKCVSLNGAKNGFFKKPELVGAGYKLVNVSELYQPFGIDTRLESVERVAATPADHVKYGVEEGDVFFTRSSLVLSGIAACNIVRRTWEPTLFECHVMKMSPDKSKVCPEYVAYCCRDPYSRRYLMSQAKQTTMTTISQPEIEQLPIPVAPLPEQRKIARILTTLDELIEKTEALIAKYQAIKQGMMHDLFTRGVDEHGHLRPSYDEAPELYKESELGWIPTEWEADSLGSIADLQVGYAFKSAWFRESGGIRLLRGENVGYGTPEWKDTQWLPFHIADMYQEYVLNPGDVIIGMDRTFTRSGFKISLLREQDCPALLVQRVGKFVPSRCNAAFLRVLLSYNQYHFALRQQEKGMDIPHLSQSEILAPIVPVPPEDEQELIAERSLSCQRLIEEEREAVAKLRLQKSGLMQDLLTGIVRVKVNEEDGDV